MKWSSIIFFVAALAMFVPADSQAQSIFAPPGPAPRPAPGCFTCGGHSQPRVIPMTRTIYRERHIVHRQVVRQSCHSCMAAYQNAWMQYWMAYNMWYRRAYGCGYGCYRRGNFRLAISTPYFGFGLAIQ